MPTMSLKTWCWLSALWLASTAVPGLAAEDLVQVFQLAEQEDPRYLAAAASYRASEPREVPDSMK